MAAVSALTRTRSAFLYRLVLLVVFYERILIDGFNIEVDKPTIARGVAGSAFGYSVAIINSSDVNNGPNAFQEKMLLVGAPNRTVQVDDLTVEGHGEVRRCPLTKLAQENITCTRVDTKDPNKKCKKLLRVGNNTCEMDMRMGATIAVNRKYGHHRSDPKVPLVTPLLALLGVFLRTGRNVCSIHKGESDIYLEWLHSQVERSLRGYDATTVYYPITNAPCTLLWNCQPEHCKCNGTKGCKPRDCFTSMGSRKRSLRDGKETIIGAPGVDIWRGAFVIGLDKYPPEPKRDVKKTTYIGYAVTSGNFRYSRVDTAVGMPNYNSDNYGYIGRVLLFQRTTRTSNIEFAVKQGTGHCDGVGKADLTDIDAKQVGSKFGAVLATADVDGDGYDELFVGAPLYSDTYTDEGRVFVYTTSADAVCGPIGVLSGSAGMSVEHHHLANRARFGTAIASVGDLNNDAVQDIAIGAPYEDGGFGAVYIYNGHGRRSEPMPNIYSQRITGTINGHTFETFGWSIYGNEDVDGNGYPDLAIGAYTSDAVVVLRSRPIVEVDVNIQMTPETIPLSASQLACSHDKFRLCTQVTVLFQYTSHIVPSIELTWSLKTDTLHMAKEGYSRVFLREDPGTSEASETFAMVSGTAVVRNYTLDVELYRDKPEPKDVWTPIRIEGWIDIINGSSNEHTKLDPVFRETVARPFVQDAEFDNKCESLAQCTSDIQTEVKMFLRNRDTAKPLNPNTALYVDNANELQVTVVLTNKNNTSYRANFTAVVDATIKGHIETHHGDVGAICEHAIVRKLTQINCIADLKLGKNEKVKVTAFFDTSRPSLNPDKGLREMQRQISVSVRGDQANTDEDTSNNNVHLTIPIPLKYDLDVLEDEVDSDQYRYHSKAGSKLMIPVTHRYFIFNNGPSFSPETIVNISVPINKGADVIAFVKNFSASCWQPGQHVQTTTKSKIQGTTTLRSTIQSVSTQQGSRRDVTVANPVNDMVTPPTIAEMNSGEEISCDQYSCMMVMCKVRALDSGMHDIVSVSLEIPEKALAKYKDIRVIRYKTKAVVTDPYVWYGDKVVPLDLSVFARKVTTFRVEPETLSTQIEIWIILLSIAGAKLLLVIIVGILFKVGFFKRKKHMQVKEWKSESLYRRQSELRMSRMSKAE